MILSLLETELRRDEAVEYSPYNDTMGIPTVGVGHNLRASPLPAGWTYPLTDAQVNTLLASDLQATFASLNAKLPWWTSLDEVRQRVIANMAFNMGMARLLGFAKMLAAAKSGDYTTAAAQMKASAWYTQVGDRAVRLCQAMATGVMPTA